MRRKGKQGDRGMKANLGPKGESVKNPHDRCQKVLLDHR